ncbi:hypothetical protein IQ276_019965 [Desmonostoc muscorum LEGE 12446]|uniref:Uncharacterized protein n=1 Tax=Desmonostoc muscorum LEGE 12446 TaxID=1828758 RepID=A0A8J7AEM3_DESMC|nr:hypothetical protein [Desmonostoc muscorum]MCF2148663.1 hypothetical protein [Desmonostoc muscorum LEGE 12446]
MAQYSLQKLEKRVKEIISSIKNENNLSNKLKEDIIQLLNSFLKNANNAEKIIHSYKQSVDQSLNSRKEPPFSWNLENCSKQKKEVNFHKDLEQYLELIGYCVFCENFDLLDTWGIQQPFKPGFRLAKSIDCYLQQFHIWKNNPQVFAEHGISFSEVEPYIKQLIHKFEEKKINVI